MHLSMVILRVQTTLWRLSVDDATYWLEMSPDLGGGGVTRNLVAWLKLQAAVLFLHLNLYGNEI
jgi:hypothetical protein